MALALATPPALPLSAQDHVSNAAERALLVVGRWLQSIDYRFTTVTPETHRRVLAQPGRERAVDARDVFGWSLPFSPGVLPAAIVDALRAADALDGDLRDLHRSRVRFSSLGDHLFVHSAFPTDDADAVFFGPDTYRFCSALTAHVDAADRVVDLGAGSGAGGISLADRCGRMTLVDCNPRAIACARVSAELAGCSDRVECAVGDLFDPIEGEVDLVIANPPYLVDASARTYRHGGGQLGTGVALRIVEHSIERLRRGGKLVLYTGSPIAGGVDPIRDGAARMLGTRRWTYRELDPDVFGDELSRRDYVGVERIAAVVLVAEM